MYQINKTTNSISKLEEKTFSELGFKERENLQEWLAGNPEALGEELLIIQKEFDGFNDTNERLDLLALDKQGNLVVIENKLDDSGKDVTWQVLKYASYCASLSKDNIKDIYQTYLLKNGLTEIAEEKLADFFEKEFEDININQGSTQRIMMVAGKFRKEVTSTVLWLMNFNMRLQCFKVTPFAMGDQLFLNVEQMLPVKDTEEFTISMASKAQDEIVAQETLKNRHHVRLEFWREFLKAANAKNNFWSNISPGKDNWIGIGIGMRGVNLNVVVTKTHCRAEIYFNRGSKDENKDLFDFIRKQEAEIETAFGEKLTWERMDEKVSCRIASRLEGVNVFDKDDWAKMADNLVDVSQRMEAAFRNPVKKLNTYAKGKY